MTRTTPTAAPGIGERSAGTELRWTRPSVLALVGVLLCTAALVGAGYLLKSRCTGPPYDTSGRSAAEYRSRAAADVCYSDIQTLWASRGINEHRIPYLDGGLSPDGQPIGGTIEYPVLTGLTMFALALPVDTDAAYLMVNALTLGVVALAIAGTLLGLAGRRTWFWALAPPLAWYAVTNWDLLAVGCVVAAFAVVIIKPAARWSPAAAVLLGLGGGFKFYPLMFLLPLALSVRRRDGRLDRNGAGRMLVTGIGTFAAVNVPFAVLGFDGWWASFRFQWQRPITGSTQSIWHPLQSLLQHPQYAELRPALMALVALCTGVGLVVPLVVGSRSAARSGVYPWLPVSAAMLCAYLLLNKVDSPQYILWVLPFLVLLPVPTPLVLTYFLADAALWFGWWRVQWADHAGRSDLVANVLSTGGLWVRAGVLVALFVIFLQQTVGRRATRLNRSSSWCGMLGARDGTAVAKDKPKDAECEF